MNTSALNLFLVETCHVSAVASCVDTNLSESEAAFESEFNKRYANKGEEQRAAAALSAAEKQVHFIDKTFTLELTLFNPL